MIEWQNVPEDISKYIGFVYVITNKLTNQKYVGQKHYWKKVTLPPLKGRTKKEKARRKKLKGNKRHKIVESDWKTYWGSSKKLQQDIEQYGEENFTKEIIENHMTKFDLSYAELLYQIENRVLFSNEWYNEMINVRLRRYNGK